MPDIDIHKQWLSEGYLVIPELINRARALRLREICEPILDQWRRANPETGKPGGDADATVMRHLNHPGYFHDARTSFNELMDTVADPNVLDVVRVVFGEEPLFRCTSLFFNPSLTSKDGDWHRDSQFTTPDDEAEKTFISEHGRDGFGMQLQVALAPSVDIEFIPRSHLRWDTLDEYAVRKADGWKNNRSNAMPGALRLAVKPGDAVLFNPSGIHRGRYHTDKLRRTLMLTYTRSSEPFFDYFSNQPWFLDPDYLAPLQPTTRHFFEAFVRAYASHW